MKDGFLKVGVYTPVIKVADVKHNAAAIIDGVSQAAKKGVKLLVFPELCLTGYTCGDLFKSPALIKAAEEAITDICAGTSGSDVLFFFGAPVSKNGALYDCAIAVKDGAVLGVVPKKTLLGDETRYFSAPGEYESEALDSPFADLTFCAFEMPDLRVSACFEPDLLDPSVATVRACLAASETIVGSAKKTQDLLSVASATRKCAVLYANAGEGESTSACVYGGGNYIYENGDLIARSEAFESGLTVSETDLALLAHERAGLNTDEDYIKIDFSLKESETVLTRKFDRLPFLPAESEADERAEFILSLQSRALASRAKACHAQKFVVGVSGGLDSSLALIVAVKAAALCGLSPTDVIAVTMPCFGTTKRTYDNARALSSAVGATLKKVDISKAVKQHLKDISHPEDVFDAAYENAQARERTQVLMDIANMENGLVVGTGDMSEEALGWCTYNGDHMSMYNVNCNIPKTLMRCVISYYVRTQNAKLGKVLADILSTPVSPELLPASEGNIAQKTEDIVGPYELHDFFLYHFIRHGYSPSKILRVAKYAFGGKYDEKTIKKWLEKFFRRFFAQQFKRSCSPDGVKVGSVSISRDDWRMPSDALATVWLDDLKGV